MRKTFLTLLVCMLSMLTAMADLPFRNHRYNGFKVTEVNNQSIVFVGNSITNMHEWWEAFGDHKIINRGVSGAVSSEMIANLEDVLAGHPAKIFFLIGTNDLGTSGINNAAYVAGNIRAAVKRCVEESPTTKVYLQSIIPSTNGIRTVALIQQTNDSIEKICSEFDGVTYIDIATPLMAVASGNSLSLDNLHLNAAGYRIWTKALEPYLDGLETVYPEKPTLNYGGMGGSLGMRSSYFANYPVAADDILMIGDDMIHGAEWHELLQSAKVKNRGTGWGLYTDMNTVKNNFSAIFHGGVKPAKVYLYMGAKEALSKVAVAEMKSTYSSVLANLKAYTGSAKIYLMSVLPSSDATTNTSYVEPLNAAIQEMAAANADVEYVDLYTSMVNGNVANTEYFNGNYVYGLGYAKIANLLAPSMGLTAITMEQAKATMAKLTARNALATAISTLSGLSIGDGVGQYSAANAEAALSQLAAAKALLTSDGATADQLAEKATALDAAVATLLEKINQPTASTADKTVWYTFYNAGKSLYVVSNGAGSNVCGQASKNSETAQWKFEARGDGSYNIINHANGTYINPVASHNTAITAIATVPTKGWTLSHSNVPGSFIISAGTVQLNQTNMPGSPLYNWSANQDGADRTDPNGKFIINVAEKVVEVPQPESFAELLKQDITSPVKVADDIATKVFAENTLTVALDITPANLSSSTSSALLASSNAAGSEYFTPIVRSGNALGVQYVLNSGSEGWFTQKIQNASLNGTRVKLVFVLDEATKTYSLYADGVLKRTVDVTANSSWGYRTFGNVEGVDGLYLGGVPAYTGSKLTNAGGTIHSVRFYAGALTADEIANLTWPDVEVEPEPKPENAAPFITTTITNDEFAADTRWYTMQIGSAGYHFHNNGTETSMSLTQLQTELADKDLWCFTGNETEGYQIYNKEAGATKVLAAPITAVGNTGATSYVILKDKNALGNYNANWQLTPSTDLGDDTPAYYLNTVGQTSNKINNRDGKLAFWTTGQNHGSSVQILFAKQTLRITSENGTCINNSNPSSTFFQIWKSSQEDPQLVLDASRNNMQKVSGQTDLDAYVGLTNPETYSLTAGEKYAIGAYEFDFVNAGTYTGQITVTAGDKAMRSSTTEQHFAVDGLKDQFASFTLGGENKGITLKNFNVTIIRATKAVEESFEIFGYNGESAVPYRIPGLAQAQNGNLIAVADYRYSKADIGMATNGKLDIRGRISTDNGKTWGPVITIGHGTGAGGTGTAAFNNAFGDPCIVADRTSSKVLMLSCAGNVSFPSGTDANHQDIAYFLSEDNGETWAAPKAITAQFYDQLRNSSRGPVRAMFIGSGKIHQSRYTKVGDYYRLYCSVLCKDVNSTHCNYVYYSDDFGLTWTLLGTADNPAIPSGTDEPKTEELPDGSIVCSGRASGGRWLNTFTFTDAATGKGTWGTAAFSGTDNKGTYGTSCNGEILLVPAVRKADGKQLWVALQSVPAASNRTKVSIYFKELNSLKDDFKDAATFAKDWDGKHQSSALGSAYSTMVLKQDGHIGFFYEEDRYGIGGGYTLVYKDYTLETITDSLYSVCTEGFDAEAYFQTCGQDRVDAVKEATGDYVGMIDTNDTSALDAALGAFKSSTTMDNYEAINLAIQNMPRRQIEEKVKYTLFNKKQRKYLSANTDGTYLKGVTTDPTETEFFTFTKDASGNWSLYNVGKQLYLANTQAVYKRLPLVGVAEAGKFTVSSTAEGISVITSVAPTTASYPAIHLDGNDEGNLVSWTTGDEGSMWYIAYAPTETGLDAVINEAEALKDNRIFDLQGRQVLRPAKGIYIVGGKKVFIK